MTKIRLKAPDPKVDVAALASYRAQAEGLIDVLTNAPCETPEQEAWFSQSLSAVRGLIKGLEDERQAVTKPMLEAKRRADALFAPATKPLQQCEQIIRGKLAQAATLRLQAAQAARLAAESAAQAGDFEAVVDALAAAPEAVSTSGSSTRAFWTFEVVDFAALPDRFKMVDGRELGALGGCLDGEPEPVPGVVWRLEAKLRAK